MNKCLEKTPQPRTDRALNIWKYEYIEVYLERLRIIHIFHVMVMTEPPRPRAALQYPSVDRGKAHAQPEVLVLDNDPVTLSGVERLFSEHGYYVRLYTQASDFLGASPPLGPACLLLENVLGDSMTGLQVHEELLRRGRIIPTVFLASSWNVRLVVNAIRGGADSFLTKPIDPWKLVHTVALAIRHARAKHKPVLTALEAHYRASALTPREREVVRLILGGFLNKQIAAQLDIAPITAQVDRGRAMIKLGAGNSAELAHIAELAGIDG